MEQINLKICRKFCLTHFHTCLPLLMICTAVTGSTALVNTNETDRQALLAVKDLISGDPLAVLSSWNQSVHFCHWQGVTCGVRHQRVTGLDMSSQELMGSLSPQIGNLTFLRAIRLDNNSFRGPIPKEIGRLFRLQYLSLYNNSFQGELPVNLTHCSKLEVLSLNLNHLEGKFPPELGLLPKLSVLRISSNRFTGRIPPSFGNLSSLHTLAANYNNLEGHIPSELGQLSNLEILSFSGNNLSGMVPSLLYNISSINAFILSANKLSGNLPPDIGLTLPNLQLFGLGDNNFSGPVPPSIVNASGLVNFDISVNNFSWPEPINFGSLHDLEWLGLGNNQLGSNRPNDLEFLNSITNCTNLRILTLYQNGFGGVLPNSITNLSSKLTTLFLGENHISGTIPRDIGNLVSLRSLTFTQNMLTGIIPESVGKLSEAVQVGMSENNISGEIPPSLGNITGLSTLILRRNMIEGSIPTALGNCTRLQILDLGYNRLTGPIPKQLIGLSSLTDGFRLGPNYLSGPLPPEVGNLKNLRQMDISRNKLFGEIPSTLGDCQLLEFLFIQNNLFEGTIPPSFKQLKGIQELDLSSNNLSGQIPGFLGELTLLHSLNLSHNMFEGEVPTEGVFSKISASSIVGNNRLCGGIPALQLPACPKMVPNKEKRPILHIIVPLVVVLSVVLLLACLALIFYRRKTSQKQASSTSQLQNQYQKLSYAELSEATNRFASTNLIGEGRYGAVYRGTLNTAEQVVAVKVLKLQEHGASKSFKAECEALRNLRHRNLVKIITTCTSLDNQGNDFKALIFEFMPNGSLDSWLHPNTPEKQDSKSLTLVQRLNIAIDVASALDYLHHHCETAISHCDLKPSNVLLDNDLCAHVSDFGLAKFILTSVSVSSHTHSSSTGIRGTIGYLAPEYGMGEEVSTQGDVYSYGIMLLEMFTGKRPTDGMFKDNLSLHNYVKLALPDRVMEIVDCKIMLLEEANKIKQRKGYVAKVESCIASILQIGLSCSADLPSERMDVGDVLMELHQIRHFHSREIELAERELEIHNSVKDKSVV